jgi:hypothetical protein
VSHQTGDPETKGLWRKRFDDTKDQFRLYEKKNFYIFWGFIFNARSGSFSIQTCFCQRPSLAVLN